MRSSWLGDGGKVFRASRLRRLGLRRSLACWAGAQQAGAWRRQRGIRRSAGRSRLRAPAWASTATYLLQAQLLLNLAPDLSTRTPKLVGWRLQLGPAVWWGAQAPLGRSVADLLSLTHTLNYTPQAGFDVTLADVAGVCILLGLWQGVLGADVQQQYKAITDWLEQCIAQPQFASVLGECDL